MDARSRREPLRRLQPGATRRAGGLRGDGVARGRRPRRARRARSVSALVEPVVCAARRIPDEDRRRAGRRSGRARSAHPALHPRARQDPQGVRDRDVATRRPVPNRGRVRRAPGARRAAAGSAVRHADRPAGARRRRPDRAVELAAVNSRREAAAGTARRQHRGGQALALRSARSGPDHPAHGRDRAARRDQPAHRHDERLGRRTGHAPAGAQDQLHRQRRGRQARDGDGGAQPRARHARARRERSRHRAGGRRAGRRGDSAHGHRDLHVGRADLHGAQAPVRAPVALRRAGRRVHRRRGAPRGGRRPRSPRHDGAGQQPAPARSHARHGRRGARAARRCERSERWPTRAFLRAAISTARPSC